MQQLVECGVGFFIGLGKAILPLLPPIAIGCLMIAVIWAVVCFGIRVIRGIFNI